MSGITIGWDNAAPANTDLVGRGDDALRSTKTNLRGMLDAEHLFPSGGGYAGIHRVGSARAHVGADSAVSSGATPGLLMAASSSSRLYYAGSDLSSFRLGDQSAPEARMWGAAAAVSVSSTSGWVISVQTLLAQTSPTRQSVWTYTEASSPVVLVTVDAEEDGTTTNAYATVQMLAGSGISNPDIYLWNPDGSTYSGDTLICQVFTLSLGGL